MDGEAEIAEIEAEDPPRRRRIWRKRWVIPGLIVVVLLGLWVERRQIAERIIADQIAAYDLPATYELAKVGANRQVLRNITIGDPAHPDLTVEEAIIEIEPRLGLPTIGQVTARKVRLYGSYKGGKLSLGSLDRLLFAETGKREGLPDLDLVLDDGRARIESDYGAIGIKAQGSGNLKDGFAGIVAAVAPKLALGGCRIDNASAYGALKVTAGQPGFKGPVRLRSLACEDLRLGASAMTLEARSDAQLSAVSGKAVLAGGSLAAGGARLAGVGGKSEFSLRNGDVTASYNLTGRGVASSWAGARELTVEGLVRSADRLARFEAEGEFSGSDISAGRRLDATLAGAGQGTLVEPLARQLRGGLARELPGSKLSGLYTWRQTGAIADVVIPRAVLRGGSGANVLALSRFYVTTGGRAGPRVVGNLATDGSGLPRLTGRIERQTGGGTLGRFTMAEYRAGDARIALPELVLVQRPGGELGFAGRALVSGTLPGGRVDGLAIPLDGTWSTRAGLAAWRGCTALRFDRLVYAALTLDARAMTLCPGRERAILRADSRGTRFAAGTAALALSGKIGGTPLKLTTGPAGFAVPGQLTVQKIDLALGDPAEPNRFVIPALTGQLGKVSSGRFARAEVRLAKVPLDLLDVAGTWRFADGELALGEGTLRLLDRQRDARFRPLIARDAKLTLKDGRIDATAMLREPASDREVVRADIVHGLANGTGHADLTVPGIVFDGKLQPDTLSTLALGVIANAKGTVRGTGRIDWNPQAVTSNGRFTTDWLDFAAAFGPVQGASGTVVFTDLLGLKTAPDQQLKLASINPGIEVGNGTVSFELKGENVLVVNGANWPFIDGRLELRPTRMVLGAAEVRRFTLAVEGANIAKFVQQLELNNVSASGMFDGELPLVFDENGGRIEGGYLNSRPPGGNVSYVGELSYKDLGAMGNFAFSALRSIDYRQMRVELDGNLEGEIISRIRFEGIRQGAGTRQNFLTKRLAALPIRFNINVRAPFQKLMASFRSLYDADYVRDPREVGLLDPAGKPAATPAVTLPEPPIQPSDSRKSP